MSEAAIVRTVLGDVAPADLGSFNYHEHLFQRSHLLPGDELDDAVKSGHEAKLLFDAGTEAMIEATPTGLGRNPRAVARISQAIGLKVVHTTGAHHGGHYAHDDPFLDFSAERMAHRFTADVLDGFEPEDATCENTAPEHAPFQPDGEERTIRAGLVKAGIRYWAIGPFETRALLAAATTHRESGAPVMVHLDYGSAAHEVLDLLASDGVPASRVVLAHIDRNLDPGLHMSLVERGAYLGFDGFARHRESPDSAILQCLKDVVESGGQNSILLGGDVARSSRYRSYGGIPGLDYLARRVLPRLKDIISADAYEATTRQNGARFLSFTPPR
ncbi:aryldialkylphosphatase [Glaciihabitans sp. UYNi722]|uniref:phosphotriesterase family protein n=1 Tax=Glaciihabitans sp. UYNi722 TaxID=3156344 RepID=UPI003395EA18